LTTKTQHSLARASVEPYQLSSILTLLKTFLSSLTDLKNGQLQRYQELSFCNSNPSLGNPNDTSPSRRCHLPHNQIVKELRTKPGFVTDPNGQ